MANEVPRPVPLGELVPMRADVRNAFLVLTEAIRSEIDARDDWGGTIPQDVIQPGLRRALGWKLFCLQSFGELLTDQVKGEMTTRGETE